MAASQPASGPQNSDAFPLDEVALRWSNLADRRLAYYVALYESGRWRHYYDERQFLARIRDVKRAANDWDRLTSRDSSEARAMSSLRRL